MFIATLLSWWYGRGWAWAGRAVLSELSDINEAFSIPTLLKTWFSPWKQIITQSTFRNFFQAALDNLISRCVGAVVRSGMILAAVFLSMLTLLMFVITVLLWPIIPLAVILLPVLALTGLGG